MRHCRVTTTERKSDSVLATDKSLRNHAPWWRHQMETCSALLALCAGNSPVTGEFPPLRPVTRSFHVFFDLRLNKRLSKQSWGGRFETPSCSLWRHRDVEGYTYKLVMYSRTVSLHLESTSNDFWIFSVTEKAARHCDLFCVRNYMAAPHRWCGDVIWFLTFSMIGEPRLYPVATIWTLGNIVWYRSSARSPSKEQSVPGFIPYARLRE